MYYFSPSQNLFIPDLLKQDYINAGVFFDDAIEVSDEIHLEFAGSIPPGGKMRIVGEDGLPTWGNIPLPTQRELIQLAEEKRQRLLSETNAITGDWRTELLLGIINDDDKVRLAEWMVYIKALKNMDLSAIINEDSVNSLEWPVAP